MSKKPSKSMAIKSAINKSALSKSAAGKSSTGKKKMDEGKSKTTDNKQRPTVSVKEAFGGNSGFSGLAEPPMIPDSGRSSLVKYQNMKNELTEAQRLAIKELKGRIKERLDAWYGKKKELADYESKVINDQRQPPPAPKYDESDFETTRSVLHDYLGLLGDEVKKLEGELDKLKKKYQRRRNIIIAVVAICLTVLVVLAVAGLVVGVILSSKSDDIKSTTTKMINGETPPDGRTGEAGTNGGQGGGQGGGKGSVKTAPITTSSTAMSTTTTMPPPVSDYEIACKPQLVEAVPEPEKVPKECLVGSSPGSCGDNAVCWQMILNIHKSDNIFKFSSNIVPPTFPPPTAAQKRLCKANDDQLGSCDQNGQCNPVEGPIDKSLYEPAVWKDNCDEPDPCWVKKWEYMFTGETKEDRTTFCEDDFTCNMRTTHAHVWMQHMRCYAGKGRTANETCKGLPMQLWLCKQCDKYDVNQMIRVSCLDSMRLPGAQVDTDCTVHCRGHLHAEPKRAPDGFNCTADDGQPGHCYKGHCFTVSAIYNANANPLPNLDQCKTDRDADKKKEAAFMRGRRKAINIYDFTDRVNARSMSEDGSSQTVALEKMAQSSIDLENVKKPHDAA